MHDLENGRLPTARTGIPTCRSVGGQRVCSLRHGTHPAHSLNLELASPYPPDQTKCSQGITSLPHSALSYHRRTGIAGCRSSQTFLRKYWVFQFYNPFI